MTVTKKPVSAKNTLNEAYDYENPVPFSRAFRVDAGGVTQLFISGTASVDENGNTVHAGDLEKQCKRMFRNVTLLLEAEGATWRDVVKTVFYHRDIDRDYIDVCRYRTEFFNEVGLKQYPASVGVEARLCRSDLLIEMEALAIYQTPATS